MARRQPEVSEHPELPLDAEQRSGHHGRGARGHRERHASRHELQSALVHQEYVARLGRDEVVGEPDFLDETLCANGRAVIHSFEFEPEEELDDLQEADE